MRNATLTKTKSYRAQAIKTETPSWRERSVSYSMKFVVVLVVLLLAAAATLTYANQENEVAPTAVQSTTQQDVESRRQINGINVLYYHPELDNLREYNDAFVERLEQLDATDIAIAIPFFMDSNTASTVTTTKETPTVDEIELLVSRAKSAGIKPVIKPLVDGINPESFTRQAIQPSDVDAWFDSYFNTILPYIELSRDQKLDSFVIGVELSSLQQYGFKWTGLINRIREVYDGALSYAVNWDAVDISFAEDLDFIGVDAYFPYDGKIANAELKEFWHEIFDELPYTEDQSFIVHEYGIPSEFGAEANPWKAEGVNTVSEHLQNTWIRAACDVIHQRTRGGYIWAVYFGTDLDQTRQDKKGYNILGKPTVENSVRDCFGWY